VLQAGASPLTLLAVTFSHELGFKRKLIYLIAKGKAVPALYSELKKDRILADPDGSWPETTVT
jgi:hypothetical protein